MRKDFTKVNISFLLKARGEGGGSRGVLAWVRPSSQLSGRGPASITHIPGPHVLQTITVFTIIGEDSVIYLRSSRVYDEIGGIFIVPMCLKLS